METLRRIPNIRVVQQCRPTDVMTRFMGITSILSTFFALAFPFVSLAHNGMVTSVYPVDGIVIDGSSEDWPANGTRHQLSYPEFGAPPRDESDFQGEFQMAYNAAENALYVLVEVEDQSALLDEGANDQWDSLDSLEVYLDLDHGGESSTVLPFTFQGNRLTHGNPNELEITFRRSQNRNTYEFRIDISSVSDDKVRLQPAMCIGFDLVFGDRDEDESYSWMSWGKGRLKYMFSDRLGDLIFMDQPADSGVLMGKVHFEQDIGLARVPLEIRSLNRDSVSVRVETDAMGSFTMNLPSGRYSVAGAFLPVSDEVTVTSGGESRVGLKVSAVNGTEEPIKTRKGIPAGTGSRIGLWQSFGVADGLPVGSIQALLQDEEENLWLGTPEGMVIYDGTSWTLVSNTTLFDIPLSTDSLANDLYVSKGARSLIKDQKGVLWIGTPRGIGCYKGEVLRVITTKDGLVNNQVTDLLEDSSGNIWITTEGGVSRYNGRFFRNYTSADGLTNNEVICVTEDSQGGIWFGTMGGLSLYDGNSFTSLVSSAVLKENRIFAIKEDRKGTLWIGTAHGIFQKKANNPEFEKVPLELPDEVMATDILEDADENLWFVIRKGLLKYDGQLWTTTGISEGLPHYLTLCLLRDREANVWVGSSSGLSRYAGDGIRTIQEKDGLINNSVTAIVKDREDHFWIGTSEGLSRFDGDRFQNFTREKNGLTANGVLSILEDGNDDIWVGTQNGVNRINREGIVTRYGLGNEFPDGPVFSIAQDLEDQLWLGLYRTGIVRYDGSQFTVITTKDGLSDPRILSLYADTGGYLWVGTEQGIDRYDGANFHHLSTEDGLIDNGVQVIHQDRAGVMWFGTRRGLSRYAKGQFTNYSVDSGLIHNATLSIEDDSKGHLWIGTAGGVSLFDGFVFQSLLQRDGLSHNAITGIKVDEKGTIWFGTRGGGVNSYRARHAHPKVEIISLKANRSFELDEEIKLSAFNELVRIQFRGLSYKTRRGALIYRYRLVGYNKEWKKTTGTEVEYNDLPRGDYRFEVQAIDRDLNYSQKPAGIAFSVRLPPWQLGYWIGLLAATILIIWQAAQIVRRNRSLRYSNTELESRVSARTLELTTEIEEHRKTEQALVQSKEFLFEAQQTARIGTWDWDMCEDRFDFSDQVHDIFGSRPDKLRFDWESFSKWIHADDRGKIRMFLDTASKRGGHQRIEYRIVAHDGTVRVAHHQGEVIRDSDGKPVRMIGTIQDVTEQRGLEAQVRESQKLEAIGHLTAGIAHNFNNLLQGVLILVDTVLLDLKDERASPLLKAKTVLGKAAGMVGQLMVISRKHVSREKRVLSLTRLVESEVDICRRTFDRKIEIVWKNSAGNLLIEGDESGLQQTILNILINARDAIGAQNTETPRIEITLDRIIVDHQKNEDSPKVKAGAYAYVKIADNGIGMDEHTKAHMFNPFFTTKDVGKGTGLGLSTSSAIARDHGGWIDCEPNQVCGATIAVYLPVTEKKEPPNSWNESETLESAGWASILIVEDDEVIRNYFQRALIKQGFTVHMAADGVLGLDLFRQKRNEIELAIVDLSMPRMRGEEMIEHLLEINPELKIVVMTGESDAPRNLKGVNLVIRKPIDLRELKQMVGSLLG